MNGYAKFNEGFEKMTTFLVLNISNYRAMLNNSSPNGSVAEIYIYLDFVSYHIRKIIMESFVDHFFGNEILE